MEEKGTRIFLVCQSPWQLNLPSVGQSSSDTDPHSHEDGRYTCGHGGGGAVCEGLCMLPLHVVPLIPDAPSSLPQPSSWNIIKEHGFLGDSHTPA
jgi:hypothetical protein